MRAVQKAASAWRFKPVARLNPRRCMPGSPEGYGRHQRIVKTDDFSSVFRLRPMQRTENFVLYLRPNVLGHARLGVVVAKRLAPRAVTRNAIKRMVREVFRKSPPGSFDCIVRLAQSPLRRESTSAPRSLRVVLGAELRRLFSEIPAPRT
jgi:ribonuclease P protein component